mmetsp:Transcript_61990/g.108551  ORF Transcript_61990/g.108551 Transcript_61990/m.108551 type:complete len:203 (-) Transcript_61990:348-956(-)
MQAAARMQAAAQSSRIQAAGYCSRIQVAGYCSRIQAVVLKLKAVVDRMVSNVDPRLFLQALLRTPVEEGRKVMVVHRMVLAELSRNAVDSPDSLVELSRTAVDARLGRVACRNLVAASHSLDPEVACRGPVVACHSLAVDSHTLAVACRILAGACHSLEEATHDLHDNHLLGACHPQGSIYLLCTYASCRPTRFHTLFGLRP